MCGIAGGFGLELARVRAGVAAMHHRGPDAHAVIELGAVVLGHARLAIQDLDPRSNQPFVWGDTTLSYNGELWNADELRKKMPGPWHTTGDTEVLAAALDRWGVDALPMLEGQFAFAWHNARDGLCIARDRFGEVPLHWSPRSRVFASEMKAMIAMRVIDWSWLEPGTWVRLDLPRDPHPVRWYDAPVTPAAHDIDEAAKLVHDAIADGCARRTVADVPVCTLLSGGIDSSIVALHLAKAIPNLVAYTAVLDPKARDLRCARAVAEALGIELREVAVAAPTADELGEVVRLIEQPHKAQVEIGHACLALARRMRDDGFKVTFSGEGSDELWASYGFAYHGVAAHGWHAYRKRLFLEQHRKNFARCNKVFLAHGVECRLPFLETSLVELALSLTQDAVADGKSKPKAVLSRAYDGLLPREVLTRAKVAFQDGMKLKDACAGAVSDPRRFYAMEFANAYGRVDP